MPAHEVVISGIGLITALGIGKAENWHSLCAGTSGIRRITRFDTSGYYTQFGGEIPEAFEAFVAQHFSKRTIRQTALFSQLCLAGTQLALEDSGLVLAEEDPTTIGICIGTGAGGLSYWESILRRHDAPYTEVVRSTESLAVVKYMANAAPAVTSLHFGLEGPSLTVANSCSSGAHAIGCASDMIRLGRAQVVIAGGVEAVLSLAALASFGKLQALSERNDAPQRASRPFDQQRDGFVLADGAGIVILESAAHCRQRRGRPYAAVCGYAMTSEAHHMVHPGEGGGRMALTIHKALQDAGMAPAQVDYISAHGTSTVINDQYETAAIKHVFGPRAYELAISSQKSMLGHTIGAAGGIEVAVTALTVANDVITPTINYEYPDAACDLDYTPNTARHRQVRVAMSNSFGFGGHNSSIVLAKA